MLSWLKKHFIPHNENDHRPHLLRIESIRKILIVVLFLEIFTFIIPTIAHINRTGGMAAVLPAILSDLTNEERQSQKIEPLVVNPILNKAAEMKAQDMATKGYFAHTSPEGKTPWYWLEQVNYSYQYAGENLAINFTDSKDVTKAWMNSPTHKANIVKGNYTEMGTGIATGQYEGRETIFVAQVYANPAIKQKVEAKINIKNELATVEEALKTQLQKETSNVLGAEVKEDVNNTTVANEITDKFNDKDKLEKNPTFLQKAFASPRNTSNSIIAIVFAVVFISIVLNIFIKIKHYHPDLLTNGLAVLAIIGAIFVINYYFSSKSMTTTQSLDYAAETTNNQ